MRAAIIKGFLPWIIFFSFANGSETGIKAGTITGLICLFLFNRGALYKKFILDWSTLSFFVFLPIIGVGFHHPLVIQYGFLWANITLTLICFASLMVFEPITLQYARLATEKTYWRNPIFHQTNYWITFIWGFSFLLSSISIGCYALDIGTQLWMIQIFPTASLIFALGFTITFPDIYYRRAIAKASGIFDIPNTSSLKHIHFNNIDITYRTIGNGSPLILAQDAYLNMHAWDPDFLKQLARSFQLFLFDYPGMGYSHFNNMPYTTKTLADCIKTLIDTLNLRPPTLLGFGMGGFIAQTFAFHYPNQVKALILINTDLGGPKAIQNKLMCQEELNETFSQDLENKLDRLMPLWFPLETIERLKEKIRKVLLSDELTGTLSQPMQENIKQLLIDWYQNDHPFEKLKKRALPVLTLTGLQDAIIPAENSKQLENALKNPISIDYDNAGHGVIYQYTHDVVDQIKMFLTALSQHG